MPAQPRLVGLNGRSGRTHEEVAGLAVVLVLEVWRAVAEARLHARGPEVGRLEDVRVGGKDRDNVLHRESALRRWSALDVPATGRHSASAACTRFGEERQLIGRRRARATVSPSGSSRSRRRLARRLRCSRARTSSGVPATAEAVDPALGHQVGVAGLAEVAPADASRSFATALGILGRSCPKPSATTRRTRSCARRATLPRTAARATSRSSSTETVVHRTIASRRAGRPASCSPARTAGDACAAAPTGMPLISAPSATRPIMRCVRWPEPATYIGTSCSRAADSSGLSGLAAVGARGVFAT